MKKILILLILCTLTGCKNQEHYSHNMFYLDTYINVKVYDIKKENSKKLFTKIEKIYSDYHKLFNRYEEYENLKNIYYINNILKENEEITIDERLKDIINIGKTQYKLTNHKLNIAIGNIVDSYNSFEKNQEIPNIDNLKKQSINLDDIKITGNKLYKTSDVKLDLGAIAKGYVTQLVKEEIEKEYDKYLINAGGNVIVGKHYNKNLYKIGIENPKDTSKMLKILKLENKAIVTSGNYQRYYTIKNKKYHHIIDPTTLSPANYTTSVTIITNDSLNADILSTYLFLLDIKQGKKYIDSLENTEAIWYDLNGKTHYSKGFSTYE